MSKARFYKHINEAIMNGEVDLENDTIKVHVHNDGRLYVGEMPWYRRILNEMFDNRAKSIHPPFTATHGVIYKDKDMRELKYFDIETALSLQDGKWKRHNPLVAYIDFGEPEPTQIEFV